MYIRTHKRDGKTIVAACDAELLGNILEDGRLRIDLDTYREFYMGKKTTKDELTKALKNFDSVNLVGRKVITVALSTGVAKERDVIWIGKIPHIQIYKI